MNGLRVAIIMGVFVCPLQRRWRSVAFNWKTKNEKQTHYGVCLNNSNAPEWKRFSLGGLRWTHLRCWNVIQTHTDLDTCFCMLCSNTSSVLLFCSLSLSKHTSLSPSTCHILVIPKPNYSMTLWFASNSRLLICWLPDKWESKSSYFCTHVMVIIMIFLCPSCCQKVELSQIWN